MATVASTTRPNSVRQLAPDICLAMSLGALAPLLYYQIHALWERPHMQFFPLAWLVFVALVIQRGKLQGNTNKARQRSGIFLWTLGLLIGVFGAVLFSPWLAHVAATLCIAGWGLVRMTTVPTLRWFAWTLLLIVTLPLPGHLDNDFVNWLQRLSSTSASALIDLLRIPHLPQGTLIEIRDHHLFVDEACSGVDSLYSLTAITLVMMLWMQRPLVVGLFAILSVPLWAWLGNVIRLVVIVVLLDKYNVDLSHGWKHTVLGLSTFALSSLCLLALIDALTQVFKRFSVTVIPGDSGKWYRWYNNVVCFPGKSPVVSGDRSPGSNVVVTTDESKTTQLRFAGSVIALLAVLVCGVFIVALTVRSMTQDRTSVALALPHYDAKLVDSVFGEQGLPEKIGNAQRVSYSTEDRSPKSFFGEHSRMWLYRDQAADVQFSVDFPFRGFHELWVCYSNSGRQKVGDPIVVTSTAAQSASGAPAIQLVVLKDQLGGYSYLWFVMFDSSRTGIPYKTRSYFSGRILEGLIATLDGMIQIDPVTYQFQMLVPSGRELTESELLEYGTYFESALPYAQSQVEQLVKQSAQQQSP